MLLNTFQKCCIRLVFNVLQNFAVLAVLLVPRNVTYGVMFVLFVGERTLYRDSVVVRYDEAQKTVVYESLDD